MAQHPETTDPSGKETDHTSLIQKRLLEIIDLLNKQQSVNNFVPFHLLNSGEQSTDIPPEEVMTDESNREQAMLYEMVGSPDSPFAVFLRHTNQKKATAQKLINTAWPYLRGLAGEQDELKGLDIGAGEGVQHAEMIRLLLSRTRKSIPVYFDLVDPKQNHIQSLKGLTAAISAFDRSYGATYDARCFLGTWDEYVPYARSEGYNFIIHSHVLYHIEPEEFLEHFGTIADKLAPVGVMAVITRRNDPVRAFIDTFYPRLHGKQDKSATIDDAIPVLDHIAEERGMKIDIVDSHAHVTIPFEDVDDGTPRNELDAQKIIEFYLRKPWDEIPEDMQDEIKAYLRERGYRLGQVDGIVLLVRNGLNRQEEAVVYEAEYPEVQE